MQESSEIPEPTMMELNSAESQPVYSAPPESNEVEPSPTRVMPRSPRAINRIYTVMLLFEAALGVLALFLGYWLESPSWRTWHWDGEAWWQGILGTIPPVILLVILLYADWDPLAKFRKLLEERVAPIFAALRWWQLLLLAAAAGWGEELLFRGLLQPLICGWLGTWPGIVTLAVVFGLAHALSPLYFALTVVMSVYLSWLLHTTGNLAVPILVHAIYDAIALVVMRDEPQESTTKRSQDFDI